MKKNPTFAEDIEDAANGEPILGIVIGSFGWGSGEDDADAYGFGESRTPIPRDMKGKPLSWEVARPMLDYDYDDGFGAPDCHNITAWTETRVLSIHEYDGSTSIISVPRNPPS